MMRSTQVRSRQAKSRRWLPSFDLLENRTVPAVVFVTTGADAGAGSFRDAIEQANNNDNVNAIIFKNNVSNINLISSVVYDGAQDLSIKGQGAAISGNGAFDLFVSSGDADLRLEKLNFRNGAKGVFVPISADASGTVSITLEQVTIENNRSHGLHIDDQTLGSDANISLAARHSTIAGNGSGAIDQDGIRLDEGGAGSIFADLVRTTVTGNGGDGLELDERGDGSANLSLSHADFVANGFLVPADLDDGVDVDEADGGNISVVARHTSFIDNFEEGLDLNEAGTGDLLVDLQHVQVRGNGEEGVDVEEFGDGDVRVVMDHVVSTDNGREGLDLKERDNGTLFIKLRHVTTTGNAQDGVKADETGAGDLDITIGHLVTTDNGERGINLDEAGLGALIADLRHILSDNPVADDVS